MNRLLFVAATALVPAALGAQTPAPAPAPVTIVPAPESRLPLKHVAQPTSPEISAKDLMTRLYIFADDSMEGREAGKAGNVKGTDYIAAEVKRLGLQPAGENGTYFQALPFMERSFDSTSTLTVDGTPLQTGVDWAGFGAASLSQTLSAVYGGIAGDTSAKLTADQVNGKLVVFNAPGSTGGRRGIRIGGPVPPGAAAVAYVAPGNFMTFLRRPATYVDDPSRRTGAAATPTPTIIVTPEAMARLFARPVDSLQPGGAGKSVALDLKMKVGPTPFPARNVVAILPGTDPKLKAQFVAIGGHTDHIGMNNRPVDHDSMRILLHLVRPGGAEDGNKQATAEQQAEINRQLAAWRSAHPNSMRADSISNGADDDGTGSVSVLEIAEKLVSLKGKNAPKRSILFVWHVGEEKGLLGSAYFTDHPTVPRDSIVAQLNIDMVGRGDAWDVTGSAKEGGALHGNPNYLQLVGSRRLSKELGDLVEQVNKDGKHNIAFDYSIDANGHPQRIYCRSDHYEYARYNIPITFFTTGGHSDYHQVTDEPQYIDYDHMARVDNLIEDIAMHVANLDHRIVVDQPKGDPTAACVQ